MVALPPLPKTLRVNLKGTYQSADWLNGFYLEYASAKPDAAAAGLVAASIEASWIARIAPLLVSDMKITSVEVIDYDSDTGVAVSEPSTGAGLAGGSNTAASIAACVSFKVNRRYRGGHPRNYVCGMSTAMLQTTQQFAASFCTNLASAYTNFFADVESATTAGVTGKTVVSWSRYWVPVKNGPVEPRPVPIRMEITGVSVDQRIDSQRRRLD